MGKRRGSRLAVACRLRWADGRQGRFCGQALLLRTGRVAAFQWSSEMGKKLYVGNLTYEVTNSELEKLFAAHGTVESAQVIMDRDTGRSKGFGFVEMKTEQEAQAAIAAMNGKDVEGRALTVNEARPRTEGGGGGRDRGGHGGGRGG